MPPRFFLDRNLGARIVPEALRNAGWDVVTMSEVYGARPGETIRDEVWIEYAGTEGMAVLFADKMVRYREVERKALHAGNVVAFALTNGNRTGPQKAQAFMKHQDAIMRAAVQGGPAVYHVSSRAVTLMPLSD